MAGLSAMKRTGDRSRINLDEHHEIRSWSRHLGVSKVELQRAVEKVGNSAAAVRKHLADRARASAAAAPPVAPPLPAAGPAIAPVEQVGASVVA